MVDFTTTISNQQMIDGLNRVIQMNYRLIRHCDWACARASGANLKGMAEQLRSMHYGHVEMISEILLALGGTPVSCEKNGLSEHFGIGGQNDQAIMAWLQKEEDDLQRRYMETIERLSASDKVVDVMERTIDDAHKQHQELELH